MLEQGIMIDIETLGTKAGCVVLSIGACEFSDKGVGKEFYGCISPESCTNWGLTIEPRTVLWWMNQSQDARDFITKGKQEELDTVLDALRAAGVTVFGASQAAAQLEGSKSFATEFMQRRGIAIPESQIVTSVDEAKAAVESFGGPASSVIKADGLAGGKGVFLPNPAAEAAHASRTITSSKLAGDHSTVIIKQRNNGP